MAIYAALAAIPKNPKMPAIIAITKKIIVQRNIKVDLMNEKHLLIELANQIFCLFAWLMKMNSLFKKYFFKTKKPWNNGKISQHCSNQDYFSDFERCPYALVSFIHSSILDGWGRAPLRPTTGSGAPTPGIVRPVLNTGVNDQGDKFKYYQERNDPKKFDHSLFCFPATEKKNEQTEGRNEYGNAGASCIFFLLVSFSFNFCSAISCSRCCSS
ncbi:MAG TPA: hypothetical protein VHZ50_13180 [Puia sp.]|nr:hypothetical protein [Puia sp.]